MCVVALRVHNLRIFQHSSNTYQEYAFVRSGDVGLNGGRVYGVGEWGYDWSHVAKLVTRAYSLGVAPADVVPSDFNYSRWGGFPPPLPLPR